MNKENFELFSSFLVLIRCLLCVVSVHFQGVAVANNLHEVQTTVYLREKLTEVLFLSSTLHAYISAILWKWLKNICVNAMKISAFNQQRASVVSIVLS